MSEAVQIVETPAVETPTTETPSPTPVVVVDQPKETFDQTLERVHREITDGKRDPATGRFQPRVVAPGAPEAAQVPGSPQTATPDPAPPVIEAPQSLPASLKETWVKAPREVQEWIANREAETHKKFTADGERLKTLTAYEEVTRPLESRLKQLGNVPATEYVRRLAAADQLLSSDGLNGIRQIAQMYGIDLRAALTQQPTAQPNQPDIDTRINEGVRKALQDLSVNEHATKIEAFRAGLSAEEQADFDKLQNVMVGLTSANPKWSLEDLYKAARRADPETLAKDEAKAKVDADKKAAEEAKKKAEQDAKLAQLGRRPGSAPTAPVKGKTWMDTMDRVGREIQARE